MIRSIYSFGLAAAFTLAACSGSDDNVDSGTDAGPTADSGQADTGPVDTGPADTGPADTGPADTGPADQGMMDSGPGDAGQDAGNARFTVTIENISGSTSLPGPFSPGAWVQHELPGALFNVGQADRGLGLVEIAEDGNPGVLAPNLAPGLSGVFTTPEGGAGPAPAFPGERYSFEIEGDPENPRLSFATMLVQTNDVVLATQEAGLLLYDKSGPVDLGDVTDQLSFYETNSEADQAPGQGPHQAPRQGGANIGREPGVIGAFADSTRAIPIPRSLVDVSVLEAAGVYTITVNNISGAEGALPTPLSPLFWMTHDDTVTLFDAGQVDRGDGIENIAEDGDASVAVATFGAMAGVGTAAAQASLINGGMGAAAPGDGYEIVVTPAAATPRLSLATMVVQSNDAFLALGGAGIELLDGAGAPRSAGEIEAEIERTLAVWDAGTEANETPGVGLNQVMQQSGPNVGPADPDNTVRRYADFTNDLDGPQAGGFVDISVSSLKGGELRIRIQNTSDAIPYTGIITPVAWAIHNSNVELFTPGTAASVGLERLAEDGNPGELAAELVAETNVANSGVVDTRQGVGSGPLLPGQSYFIVFTPQASHPLFSFASMIVPSNDTFLAPGAGVSLFDSQGVLRLDADIEADLQAAVRAWDAGTEANQASAAGRDQAPRQSGPNVGEDEEQLNIVTPVSADPVWAYPAPSELVRVTVTRN